MAPPSVGDLQALLGIAGAQDQQLPSSTSMQAQSWKAYRPCGSCKQYVRVGEEHDGGYVMCSELLAGTGAAYSYGINGYDGWGSQLSRQLGIRVEQYDCYNLKRPSCFGCNFAFHGECISSYTHRDAGKLFNTLRKHMAANGHTPAPASGTNLILKMDVEGSEWEVFADPSIQPLLAHFSQIVVEFHGTGAASLAKHGALQNLLRLFTVVHVHGNNCCPSVTTAEGYSIPSVLEVTFARRGMVTEGQCQSSPASSPHDHRNLANNLHTPPIRLP